MARPSGTIDEAEVALALAQDDPAACERVATRLITDGADPHVRQLALWARGRARHERGRFGDALDDFCQAVAVAGDRGDSVGEARILANRALTEYAAGHVDAALASLALAEGELTGAEAGHLHLQRAIIEVHTGELVRARHSFDDAFVVLAAAHDHDAVARCLASRGVASCYLGEFDDAAEDLERAIAAANAGGQRLVAAGAVHNLGYVRARQGDLPAALELLGRAEDLYRQIDSPARVVAALLQDRAELLLHGGLVTEAVTSAKAAIDRHDAAGCGPASDDSCLLLAEALLAAGRPREAGETARAAADRLLRAGREPWAARAGLAALRAEHADADTSPLDETVVGDRIERCRAIARALSDAGWHHDAIQALTLAGVVALYPALELPRGVDRAVVCDLLDAASSARHAGPVGTRITGWHATGMRRLLDGDREGACQAAEAGMALVAEHRRSLAATELRAGAARHSVEVARFGLRLALSGGDACGMFDWIERSRARSLAALEVDPADDDPELRVMLGHLRAAHADVRASPASVEAQAQLTALETAVRDHDHRRPGRGSAEGTIGSEELKGLLGERLFVSFVQLDGQLFSLVATGDELRLRRHGSVRGASEAVERLRFSLRRLVRGGTSRGVAAARAAFEADRRDVDSLLAMPELADRPLVLAPSAALSALAWSALPSVAGREVTLTPSASVWASPPRSRPRPVSACFVAGPGLPAAAAEVAAGAAHAGGGVLLGSEATVEAVLGAFRRVNTLHVAAHGTFRSDSPLFSGFELWDGPLTLFDLRPLGGAPELVVLPSCNLAATRVLDGDEPLGAVAALLALGARTVVAPIDAVSDGATADLMSELHRRLAAGEAPALALGHVVTLAAASEDPSVLATAASFICSGRR